MKRFKTSWRDALFSLGELVFIFLLIPSVVGPHKPAALTSAGTAGILYMFAGLQASYKNIYAAILLLVTASLWLTMFIQVV